MPDTECCATKSVPAPITASAMAAKRNAVISIWRWPGVVRDRLRARSTRSRSDRPNGGLAVVTGASPSGPDRRSAASQIHLNARRGQGGACPHLHGSLALSGQPPHGELREESELDHVVRSEQLDLAALQRHAVDARAVRGTQVA